jgi:chitosanase
VHPSLAAANGLTSEQKTRAARLISLFENGTPEIQYGYVEALGDGRGYTAGRGLTTATGDVLDAVNLYTARVPNNQLSRFIPRLAELAADQSDDTAGLDGFAPAWSASAADPIFRAVQDAINDRNSYEPAMALAARLGVRSALGCVIVYDTVFMHGLGADGEPDGALALVDQARARAGGLPADGVPEKTWLDHFLAVRRADLQYAHDPATRAVWAQAVDRVDILATIASSGNYDFVGPLGITGAHSATIQ